MIQHAPFTLILTVLAALAILVALNASLARQPTTDVLAGSVNAPLGALTGRLGFLRSILDGVIGWRELFLENLRLKGEVMELKAERARMEALSRENQMLRTALKLPVSRIPGMVPAGIFGVRLGPEGYRALVNRGASAGVKPGALIVSASGALIGKVTEVFDRVSAVQLLVDPGFEITVRVGRSGTTGIARGKGSEGLTVELIVQDEDVKEGDLAVSSGTDLFPAALVVGTVDHVREDEGQLFKEVRVQPATENIFSESVFILEP